MRKCVVFAATLLLFVIVSCNQDYLNPTEVPTIWDVDTRAEKNPLDEIDFSALDTAYFVSDKDVEAYIHFKQLLAEGQGKDFEVLEIVPMGLNDEATLAYLLNYNEGWEIIAADKRAPTVLASDETGSFSGKETPENVIAWIKGLETDILYLRTFNNRPEGINDEIWDKMLGSMDFWNAINADEEFIYRNMGGTRYVPDGNPVFPPEGGHWELVSTTCEYNVLHSIDHLITTTWGLGSNIPIPIDYNRYCPQKQNSPDRVSPTSAAVSGAQMAYFLHNKIGVGKPINSPSSIYCTAVVGNIDYGTNFYIEGMTSGLWSSMSLSSPSTSAAKLIAGIVYNLRISYPTNNTANVPLGGLKYLYFDNENITCSFELYNTSVIDSSLIEGMPVIAEIDGFEGWNDFHCNLIIDCFQAVSTRYTYEYDWVYDTPDNGTPRPLLTRTEIEYVNPTIMQYGMNWSLGGAYNTSWFSKSGLWEVDDMIFPGNYTRKMYVFQEDELPNL